MTAASCGLDADNSVDLDHGDLSEAVSVSSREQ